MTEKANKTTLYIFCIPLSSQTMLAAAMKPCICPHQDRMLVSPRTTPRTTNTTRRSSIRRRKNNESPILLRFLRFESPVVRQGEQQRRPFHSSTTGSLAMPDFQEDNSETENNYRDDSSECDNSSRSPHMWWNEAKEVALSKPPSSSLSVSYQQRRVIPRRDPIKRWHSNGSDSKDKQDTIPRAPKRSIRSI